MRFSLSPSLSAKPLGISYRDLSQWQQMSGWQGGFKGRAKQVPAPELSAAESQKWQVHQQRSHF